MLTPMKGLVLNDLVIMRESVTWSYLFPIVVVGIAGIGNPRMLLTGMPMVILFLSNSLVMCLFSREEASGWRIALRSLPVTAFDTVVSRFFVAAATLLATCAVTGLVGLVAAAIAGVEFDCVLIGSMVGFWLIMAYDSFLFPFFYRFGSGKANIATMTLVGMMILAMYLMQQWGVALDFALLMPMPVLVSGAAFVLVFMVFVSMLLSSKVVSADFLSRDYFCPSDR